MCKKVMVQMMSSISMINVCVGGVGDGGHEHASVHACLCVWKPEVVAECLPRLLPCLLRQDLFLNLGLWIWLG